MAATGTPAAVVTQLQQGAARAVMERLNREILAALAQPNIREKFEEFGIDTRGGTPEILRDLLSGEIAKWKNVVETTGIEKQ